MLKITDDLYLKKVLKSDTKLLFNIMKEIYPLAYSYFWKDKGAWYVHTQYSKKNIEEELSEKKSAYYFIVFKDEIIGNFRVLWDEKLEGLKEEKQVKLHRIYLHQKIQGQGIGKILLTWLEQKAFQKGYKIIWLDAMNEQPQAFQFYKNLGYVYHSHTFLPYELLYDKVRKMSQIYKIL